MEDTRNIKGLTRHKGLSCLCGGVPARLRHVPCVTVVDFASPDGVSWAKIDAMPTDRPSRSTPSLLRVTAYE